MCEIEFDSSASSSDEETYDDIAMTKTPMQQLQATAIQQQNEEITTPFKLAPFNPSSEQIQQKALQLLQLQEAGDVLFDLGCGDGRFLIKAATQIPGLKCVGIEIDSIFVQRAKDHILTLPKEIQSRIDIRLMNVLDISTQNETNDSTETMAASINATSNTKELVTDLTLMDDATALYLFVLPKGVLKIMPIINALVERRKQERRRLQVLSYMFQIHDWGEPTVVDKTAKGGCPVYYYNFNF